MIGDLNPTALATLLNPELDEGSEVVAVDAQHRLIYSSQMGEVADDAAMLAAGALSTTVDNTATQQAFSTGESGVARFTTTTRAMTSSAATTWSTTWAGS